MIEGKIIMGKKNQKLAILVALIVASTFTGCSNKTAEQSESVAEVGQANATGEKKYVSHLTENGEGIAIVREARNLSNWDQYKTPLIGDAAIQPRRSAFC